MNDTYELRFNLTWILSGEYITNTESYVLNEDELLDYFENIISCISFSSAFDKQSKDSVLFKKNNSDFYRDYNSGKYYNIDFLEDVFNSVSNKLIEGNYMIIKNNDEYLINGDIFETLSFIYKNRSNNKNYKYLSKYIDYIDEKILGRKKVLS